MELATAQRLMAQIFTNADFRAQVAADPGAVVEQWNLSSSDGRWLQDYAYRINISWWLFGIGGIAAILIALTTISFQAIKAAMANPVKSLRNE